MPPFHSECVEQGSGPPLSSGAKEKKSWEPRKTVSEGIFQSVLVNYLVSQARTVEGSLNRALWAVLERNERLASEVFLTEPRINEMEILIDQHAVRLLRQGNLLDTDFSA